MKRRLIKWRKLNEKQRYIVSSLLFLAVCALILTWFLEYRYFLNSMYRTWAFVIGSPLVFLFNAFIMWLMMVFVWGVIGSPTITAGSFWGLPTCKRGALINEVCRLGLDYPPVCCDSDCGCVDDSILQTCRKEASSSTWLESKRLHTEACSVD